MTNKLLLLFSVVLTLALCGSCTAMEPETQISPSSQSEVLKTPLPSPIISATNGAIEASATSNDAIPTNTPPPVSTSTPTMAATPSLATPESTSIDENLVQTTEVSFRCGLEEQVSTQNTIVNGLAVAQEDGQGVRSIEFLNDTSTTQIKIPQNSTGSIRVSPDKKQFAFFVFEGSDLLVLDIHGEEIAKYPLQNVSLSSYAPPKWLNSSQIIIPLDDSNGIYQWIIWSPFDDSEILISTTLEDIGEERYRIGPVVDSLSELVVYPCEECSSGAEYVVKDTATSATLWEVDIDPNPTDTFRGVPIWSPNGEYLVVTAGRNWYQNGLWIFDRGGSLVYDITLPNMEGELAATALTWSPDSQFLAFRRLTNPVEGLSTEKTLSYISLANGEVIDLCVDFSEGEPIWSPNSMMITINEEREQQSFLQIVDINSGDIFHLNSQNVFEVIGWFSGQ